MRARAPGESDRSCAGRASGQGLGQGRGTHLLGQRQGQSRPLTARGPRQRTEGSFGSASTPEASAALPAPGRHHRGAIACLAPSTKQQHQSEFTPARSWRRTGAPAPNPGTGPCEALHRPPSRAPGGPRDSRATAGRWEPPRDWKQLRGPSGLRSGRGGASEAAAHGPPSPPLGSAGWGPRNHEAGGAGA